MGVDRGTAGIGVAMLTAGLVAGVLIGHFGRSQSDPKQSFIHCESSVESKDLDARKTLFDEVDKTKLEENLRTLTLLPHIAGSKRDEVDLVKFIAESWRTSGFSIAIHPYEVLLSYPNQTDSNYVAMVTQNGEEVLKSQPKEKVLDDSQDSPDVVNPFNAYAKAGNPEGDLIYVNYGRIEDFQFLQRNVSIYFTGLICIIRYGKIFRGDKVTHAEEAGCAGVILYSDPKEYTVAGKDVYPDSWYLPGTGAQRGTVFSDKGDPETPGYPSIDSAWRLPESRLPVPKIPVTPIGYDDAVKYLSWLRGPEAPKSWQGGLNITYRIGPGFRGIHSSSSIKVHVSTQNERRTTRNVIGYIRGTVEPDRYVLFGSHRDAWVFGSIDPSSAQAIMLEVGRVMGEALKKGWRPRRTIILCSWGAEEYGLLGSSEWVEEFQKNLASRAVVYINLDTAILGGYTLYTGAVPGLVDLVYNVTKTFPNPDDDEVKAGRPYLYDSWRQRWPSDPNSKDPKPATRQLAAGSDYTSFLQVAGVSVLDFAYIYDFRQGIDFYPTYHSVYETFDYMAKFVDPGFKYHQVLTRFVAEVGRRLIDSPVLPINVKSYAVELVRLRETILRIYGSKMEKNGIDTSFIINATNKFVETAQEFEDRVNNLQNQRCMDVMETRALNDQMMQLERAFIDGNGIAGRETYKHVIYAPSQHDSYSGIAFPGLVDSMFDIDVAPDQQSRWNEVQRQYSILVYHIQSAASTLHNYTPMQGASNT